MMMMIPEAWENHTLMDRQPPRFLRISRRDDGAVGRPGGDCIHRWPPDRRTLDRNGLRPARYIVTDDDLVIMGSECGCLPIPEECIVKKWRLQPGKMFLIDLEKGRIIDDKELKDTLANAKPYGEWIESHPHQARRRRKRPAKPPKRSGVPLLDRQQAFGLHAGRHQVPDDADGHERRRSRSARWATIRRWRFCRTRTRRLYHYFKQLFAQVTNPPIDPIREELVMSLVSFIGPKPNLLGIDELNPPMRLEVSAAGARFLRDGEDPRNIEPLHRRQVQVV